jgi:hypothetical protein
MTSVSQPECSGTSVCSDLLLGVPLDIFLAYFSIFTHFRFHLFLFNTTIRALRCRLSYTYLELKVCRKTFLIAKCAANQEKVRTTGIDNSKCKITSEENPKVYKENNKKV